MSNSANTCVVILGCGGIGSALFQDLCRFLPHMIDIHLVDGDTVEGRNLQRQHFSRKDRDRNKAEALQEKATAAIGLDRIYAHPNYLEKTAQLHEFARYYNRVILVGCVDNHPARRVQEAFVREFAREVFYVDCANSEHFGEVVTVLKRGNQIQGAFRSEIDPSVLTDNEGDPTKVSCNQQLDSGNLQTLFTNRKAAIIALELVAGYMANAPQTGMVYFNKCEITRLQPPRKMWRPESPT